MLISSTHKTTLILAGTILSFLLFPPVVDFLICSVTILYGVTNTSKKYVFAGIFFILALLSLDTTTSDQTTLRPATNELSTSTETALPPASEIPLSDTAIDEPTAEVRADTVHVTRVIDGDTIDVLLNGETMRIRLIGINTPETVDPRKPVECFGAEASAHLKSLLTDQAVTLEIDESQGDTDKYGRLLRYVFLKGDNVNLTMIKEGYAYEYTYSTPYHYQTEFKAAEADAREHERGLWGTVCTEPTSTVETTTSIAPSDTPDTTVVPTAPTNSSDNTEGATACTIKGNINSEGEKIYHVIGCQSYNKTIINEDAGEHWFCSEAEALAAGWRKALNCY